MLGLCVQVNLPLGVLLFPEWTHVHCLTSPGGRVLVRSSRSRDSWVCHFCVSSLAPSPSHASRHRREAGDREGLQVKNSATSSTLRQPRTQKTQYATTTQNSRHARCPSNGCADMQVRARRADALSHAGTKTSTSEWKQNPVESQRGSG